MARLGVFATAAWLGAASVACTAAEEGRSRFLSIGTAGTGGIYYPLGGALAGRLSLGDSSHQYTAEVTGGSVENVNRVASGEMDLGMSIATTLHEAYHGGVGFDEPLRSLRLVAPLYPNVTQILVARQSEARTVADLRNQRVSVGAPGSGTEQVARQLLEAYGLAYDDVEVRFLSFRESADALRDGAIEGAIFSVGYPASAVLEATTNGDARLLAVDEEQQAALEEAYPYYRRGVIPAGAYPGQEEEVPTVAVMNWVFSLETLEGPVARSVLDVVENERDELEQVHDIARQIDLGALEDPPIPLHPASRQWMGERGEGGDGTDTPALRYSGSR